MNTAVRLKKKSRGISDEIWAEWHHVLFNTDAFKKRSATNKANRLTEKGGPGTGISNHSGGSRSFIEWDATLVSIFLKLQLHLLMFTLINV